MIIEKHLFSLQVHTTPFYQFTPSSHRIVGLLFVQMKTGYLDLTLREIKAIYKHFFLMFQSLK